MKNQLFTRFCNVQTDLAPANLLSFMSEQPTEPTHYTLATLAAFQSSKALCSLLTWQLCTCFPLPRTIFSQFLVGPVLSV